MPRFNIPVQVGPVAGAAATEAQLGGLRGASAAVAKQLQMMALAAAAAGVALAAMQVRRMISLAIEHEKALKGVEAIIRATGGAAGLTTRQVSDMANELQRATGESNDEILGMQRILLTFKAISGESFGRATELAMDLAATLGTDLRSAAIQVGKALQDPARQMTFLRRSGLDFTEAEVEMARAMQEVGDIAGAQEIVFKALETQLGGVSRATRDTLGGALKALGNEWDDLLKNIAGDVSKNPIRTFVEASVKALQWLNDNFQAIFAGWKVIFAGLRLLVAEFLSSALRPLFVAFERLKISEGLVASLDASIRELTTAGMRGLGEGITTILGINRLFNQEMGATPVLLDDMAASIEGVTEEVEALESVAVRTFRVLQQIWERQAEELRQIVADMAETIQALPEPSIIGQIIRSAEAEGFAPQIGPWARFFGSDEFKNAFAGNLEQAIITAFRGGGALNAVKQFLTQFGVTVAQKWFDGFRETRFFERFAAAFQQIAVPIMAFSLLREIGLGLGRLFGGSSTKGIQASFSAGIVGGVLTQPISGGGTGGAGGPGLTLDVPGTESGGALSGPSSLAEAGQLIRQFVQQLSEAGRFVVQELAQITIQLDAQRGFLASVMGTDLGAFKTLEEAVKAAVAFAVQTAEIIGGSAEVGAALAKFGGGGFEKLLEMIQKAASLPLEIASLAGIGTVGEQAQTARQVAELAATIKSLGLAASLEARRLRELEQAAGLAADSLKTNFLDRVLAAAERIGLDVGEKRVRLEQLQFQITLARLELEAKMLGFWQGWVPSFINQMKALASDVANFAGQAAGQLSAAQVIEVTLTDAQRLEAWKQRGLELKRVIESLVGQGGGAAGAIFRLQEQFREIFSGLAEGFGLKPNELARLRRIAQEQFARLAGELADSLIQPARDALAALTTGQLGGVSPSAAFSASFARARDLFAQATGGNFDLIDDAVAAIQQALGVAFGSGGAVLGGSQFVQMMQGMLQSLIALREQIVGQITDNIPKESLDVQIESRDLLAEIRDLLANRNANPPHVFQQV